MDFTPYENTTERKAALKSRSRSWLASRVAYLERQAAYVAQLDALPGDEGRTLRYCQRTLERALYNEPE